MWGVDGREVEAAWEAEGAHLKAEGFFLIIFHANYLTFKAMHLLLGLWLSNVPALLHGEPGV